MDRVDFPRYFLPLKLLMNLVSEEAYSWVETILEAGNYG